jgi:phosphatidylserine decarboxylase
MIDRSAWPFIIGALILAAGVWWWQGRIWALPFLVLAAFFVFFFRDPERVIPSDPDLVVSPADARIMIVGDPGPGAPPGQWQRISMFLSPMDVHVNRMPVAGRVTRVEYHPGKFLPAYREDAGTLNEWTEVWIDHHGMPIVVRQIVGILARRIVCRAKVGDVVQRGDRFGIMKFGSRIDMFVPAGAKILSKVGDKVVGGVTPVAMLESQPGAPKEIRK